MSKVLITSPRGKENLVKAFKEAGAEVVTSMSEDVRLIIPTVDEELWLMANTRDWFKEKGITVACSSEFTINTCRNKNEFHKFCRIHGFNIPLTLKVPVIAKPVFGKGSRGFINLDKSYVVQEKVEWPEYSIDYYRDENIESIIPRKRLCIVNGESKDCEINMSKYLVQEASRLGKELGLEYHNVMQCFFNEETKEIKWIEVNLRYGGGSWMTFERFNSPKYLLEKIYNTTTGEVNK